MRPHEPPANARKMRPTVAQKQALHLLQKKRLVPSSPASFPADLLISKPEDSAKKFTRKQVTNRFPREVFAAAESSFLKSPQSDSITTKDTPSKASPVSPGTKKTTSAAQVGPSTLCKVIALDQTDLMRPLAALRPEESSSERIQSLKSYSARRVQRREGSGACCLPPITQPPHEPAARGMQRTLGRAELSMKLAGETVRFAGGVKFADDRPIQRQNSNQIINLEMASGCKVKINPPRVTVNLEHALNLGGGRTHGSALGNSELSARAHLSHNMVRLKPIQRNAYSSQGTTIKVLLPKEFVESRTRPSSKEDESLKHTAHLILGSNGITRSAGTDIRPQGTTRKIGKTSESAKQTAAGSRGQASATGLELINRLVESKGSNAAGGVHNGNYGELCNVTFGEKQFKNVRAQFMGIIN